MNYVRIDSDYLKIPQFRSKNFNILIGMNLIHNSLLNKILKKTSISIFLNVGLLFTWMANVYFLGSNCCIPDNLKSIFKRNSITLPYVLSHNHRYNFPESNSLVWYPIMDLNGIYSKQYSFVFCLPCTFFSYLSKFFRNVCKSLSG